MTARIPRRVALTVLLMVTLAPLALADRNDPKDRGRPGMHQEGPDHFEQHHGPEGMAQGWGARLDAVLDRLDKDAREAVRQAQVAMRRKMNTLGAELRNLQLDLWESMRKIPLDLDAALDKWEAVKEKSKEIFMTRLEHLRELQRLLGEELWGELTDGGAPGMGRAMGGPPRGPMR